jgi:putative ABC transport system permease protein
MLQGKLSDLRRSEGVIVDGVGANGQARQANGRPGEADTTEGRRHAGAQRSPGDGGGHLRDHAHVPVAADHLHDLLPRGAVRAAGTQAALLRAREGEGGQDIKALCARITEETGLGAYTHEEFKTLTYDYFMKYTGIPINFGISVMLASSSAPRSRGCSSTSSPTKTSAISAR